MPYDLLPFVIIFFSFIIIIFIIGRKIPDLRVLDIATISEEKEQKVKKTILELRLKRNLEKLQKVIIALSKPLIERFFRMIKNFYFKVLDLEKNYKNKVSEKKEMNLEPEERIEKYLREARENMANVNKLHLAEEFFIRAIEVDNKNLEAYRGLYDVYVRIKDYNKARDVGKYLLKLCAAAYKKDKSMEKKQELALYYANLGEVEENLTNTQGALKCYKEASRLMPNNPKFLDLLLKISIIIKDKKLALSALKQLKQADPENQKIVDLEKEVDGL